MATLAHRLRDRIGIAKGDRVAIAMRNLPEWVVAFWAVAVAGAVVVPLNAWWTGEELAYGLADSGAVVAFVDTERALRLRPHLADLADLRTIVVADEHRGATSAETGGRAAGGTAELSFPEVLGPVADRRRPARGRTSNPTTTPPSSTPRAPPDAQGGGGHPSQHLHQPDGPVLHQLP